MCPLVGRLFVDDGLQQARRDDEPRGKKGRKKRD